jgi:hypothetical protein
MRNRSFVILSIAILVVSSALVFYTYPELSLSSGKALPKIEANQFIGKILCFKKMSGMPTSIESQDVIDDNENVSDAEANYINSIFNEAGKAPGECLTIKFCEALNNGKYNVVSEAMFINPDGMPYPHNEMDKDSKKWVLVKGPK